VTRLLAATLALGGAAADGWVEIDGEHIGRAGHGPPPRAPDERLEGVLAAGLVDLQVNGAGGHEVTGGAAALDAIDAVQLAHGVTAYLPTLVSPDDATAERALDELGRRSLDAASPVAGIHVEGPFISPSHAGMHPVSRLRTPVEGVPDWLDHPAITLVTIAPELPGALELIGKLSARGVVVALGHSGADAETTRAAIDAGAGLVTHVFNAMGPLHHREPGLAGVALVDERLYTAVIADGVHIHPLVLELVRRAAGDRAVLVSDSTPAAGASPGRYEMAGVAIERGRAGEVLTDDGRLAGSSLTLDEAVRAWRAMTAATLAEALYAATEAPALAADLPGGLKPGAPARLVLLDGGGSVRRVMFRGRWLDQVA
jgi:N-acetylglucosamine-6-phosphate deacetylase